MHDRDRFDKFTERARKVLSLAQEEAQRFQHNYIGTEHLLLGLTHDSEGVAAKVLANLGIELNQIRNSVEFIIGRGDRIVLGETGLTPRAKKVIELAVDEAHRLNHHYVGTEHLLLGFMREGEGIAAGVLENLGINLEKVRTQTIQVLSQSSTAHESPTTPPLPSERQEVASPVAEKNLAPSFEEIKQINGDRFDKFTGQAMKVISLAHEDAQRFQHHYIGTEHLLLGLIREGEGVAAKVLANLGVELNKARRAVEFIIGRGPRIIVGEIGLTPRAKKVIELAGNEAQRLNHHYIGTEHLLLGLVREGEGIAAGILNSLGANLEKVHAQTLLVLSQSTGSLAAPPIPPEAATLVAESNSALQCTTCQARCPSYFTYCFHCGSKLKPQGQE
jgi:ATP-dependent Clp protease ATP-binding subunit ClpA